MPADCRISLFLALAMGIVPLAASAAEPGPQEQLQTRYGLRQHRQRVWILPLEAELRAKIAELPRRRERIVAAEKELETALDALHRTWKESQPVLAGLKHSLARMTTDDPQRKPLQQQLEATKAALIDLQRLGSRPDLRMRVVDLSTERAELLTAVAWIRDTLPKLRDRYAALAEDAELARLVQECGDMQRLGPQRSYRSDFARLGEYERLAATSWVPCFQQSGQTRLMALLDERAAATFTWTDASDQPLVVTSSTAERAQLEVPADAPREAILAAPGRKITARRITLRYLRLGGCLLHHVPAYVLPPEAEDIGNRLGGPAMSGHTVRSEPERLRLWIDAEP